jgi:hypothetical protein
MVWAIGALRYLEIDASEAFFWSRIRLLGVVSQYTLQQLDVFQTGSKAGDQ